jgi:RimJ/RimL family protein N-acetyltransferase
LDSERRTERLTLVPGTTDHIRAEIDSPKKLGSLLGADVPGDWPPGEYDPKAREFFLDRMEAAEASARGWFVWYAILRGGAGERPVVIGTGGFLGPPGPNGDVEIGYSVSEAWRGRGLGREIVEGLVHAALDDPRVTRILAHTAVDNAASRSILDGAGFSAAGPGAEPGTIRFELNRRGEDVS